MVLVALGLAPRPAAAQAAQSISGFADDRFEPAGADSQWMTGESLEFRGHLRPAAALVEDWAVNPIVAYGTDGSSTGALVGEQVFTHLDAAMMAWDRVRFDLNLPLSLVSSGAGAQIAGQSYGAPEGRILGDIRLGADARILERASERWGRVVAAAGLQLFLPTGATRAFIGDGGVRVWPRVMAAGERGRLTWAARLGVEFRPKDHCGCSLAPGSEMNGALAGGWRFSPRLMVGPELFASAPLAGSTLAARATPAVELMAGAHFAIDPRWQVSAGISRGLTEGAGAPAFRGVVGVQFVLPLPAAPPALGAPGGGPATDASAL
jgi:hypothetical protein